MRLVGCKFIFQSFVVNFVSLMYLFVCFPKLFSTFLILDVTLFLQNQKLEKIIKRWCRYCSFFSDSLLRFLLKMI